MNINTIVNAFSNRFSALVAPPSKSNDKLNTSPNPEQTTNIVFRHLPQQRSGYNSFLSSNANNSVQQVVPDMTQSAFPPIANDDWVAIDDDNSSTEGGDVDIPSYLNIMSGTGDDHAAPIEEPGSFVLPQGWSHLARKSGKPKQCAKNYAEIGQQIVDALTQKHQSFISEYNSIHGEDAYQELYWLPPVYSEDIWHDRQNDFSSDIYEYEYE